MALRTYILHNFWWKLLSVLLASLTWLTIETAFQRDQNLQETPVVISAQRTFPAVPITLMTATTNANQYRLEPAFVAVDISGATDKLGKLQEKQIHVFVDVSDAGDEKKFRRTIQAQVPPDLKVASLMPIYTSVERIPK